MSEVATSTGKDKFFAWATEKKKNSSCMKYLKPTNLEESGSGRLKTDITKITLDIPWQDCFGSDNSKKSR